MTEHVHVGEWCARCVEPVLARIVELEAGLRELVDWCIAGPDDSWPPKLREYRSLLAPAQEDRT